MTTHEFIFQPGNWIGEGKITFSASPERLRFYTKWIIEPMESGLILCRQQVEMEGREENLHNNFEISHLQPLQFSIKLNSELMGALEGKGLIDSKTIAWEFRGEQDFEGFEVYELQENGDYMLHAEYMSTEQFRTIVDGRIWKKST